MKEPIARRKTIKRICAALLMISFIAPLAVHEEAIADQSSTQQSRRHDVAIETCQTVHPSDNYEYCEFAGQDSQDMLVISEGHPAAPELFNQPGVKRLVTHKYNTARRRSTGWIDVGGVNVPVDTGVEHDGVKVYMTLMFEIVAVDVSTGEAMWHNKRQKTDPFWQVVSIVELSRGEGTELAVELVPGGDEVQPEDFHYLDLRTGATIASPSDADRAGESQRGNHSAAAGTPGGSIAHHEIDDLVEQARSLGDWNSPETPVQFDSIGYLKLARALMQLDESTRTAVLREFARQRLEGQLIVLCRMLFVSKTDDTSFRRPHLGEPFFVATGTTVDDWPLEPITLIENVPLRVVTGYRIVGEPESAARYLEYCLTECDWTERTFDADDRAISRVADSLLTASFWGENLDQREWLRWIELRNQILPSALISVRKRPWVTEDMPSFYVHPSKGSGAVTPDTVVDVLQQQHLPPDGYIAVMIWDDAKPEWLQAVVEPVTSANFRTVILFRWQQSRQPVTDW